MPKFLVTPVGSTTPAATLPFQSAQTNDGSAQLGQSMAQFGQTIGQIANQALLAQQSQAVTNANTITQLDLASLNTASDLKQMGITEATTEYRKRARDIYNNATKDMSPSARRLFEKSWGPNSSSAFVKFQAAAVKRTTQKLEANIIKNEDDAILLSKTNGFDLKTLGSVHASYQNGVTNGVYSADQAATKTVAFTRRYAKSALTHHINVSSQSQNEVEMKQTYKDLLEGGKNLPKGLKFWWNKVDPEDQKALVKDAESRLSQFYASQTRTNNAKEKLLKKNQQKLFGSIKLKIDAADDGDETAAMEVWEYTPEYFLQAIRDERLTGKDAAALQTLITAPDQLKTHVPSFNELMQDGYDILDLPDSQQRAAFDSIKDRATDLVNNNQLTGGDLTKVLSLVKKLETEQTKMGPIARERKRLRRTLNIPEGASYLESIQGKPQSARAQAALTEYDAEMLDDNSPYRDKPGEYVNDLLERVLDKAPRLNRLMKPRFMDGLPGNLKKWEEADVTAAKLLLLQKKNARQISDGVFTRETSLLNKIKLGIEERARIQEAAKAAKKDRE